RKCHQDPNLGHADSEYVAITTPMLAGVQLELFWIGNDGENIPHVLSQPAHILEPAGCRP
ncbi:MAG: hypothetical protein IKQ72_04000, partial [Bacteroidaceae bacterium]|nr:hypothetical protein [Bacteroidaceae bacterium]